MTSAVMLSLVLCGPPPNTATPTADVADSTIVEAMAGSPRSADELRDSYRSLLRKSRTANERELAVVVPQLAALYTELGRDARLPRAERSRMLRGLKSRLLRIRETLSGDNARRQEHAARDNSQLGAVIAAVSRTSRRSSANRQAQVSGGAAGNSAQNLIDLIQATVDPESWIANPDVAIIAFPGGFGPAANPGGLGGGLSLRALTLIELIQTIEPPSWEINGGNGVILPFGK